MRLLYYVFTPFLVGHNRCRGSRIKFTRDEGAILEKSVVDFRFGYGLLKGEQVGRFPDYLSVVMSDTV